MKRTLANTLLIAMLVFSVIPLCTADFTPSDYPNLDSIYVDVVVMPNGRINVTYWMNFTAAAGGLGGFDLRGIAEETIDDSSRAYAEWGGNRYDLLVTNYADGYGLDWVPRTPEGEQVQVVFGYFSTNRIIEKTTSGIYGDLGVFNWAPVQWEIPIDYEAVQVIYPIEMNASWIEPSNGVTAEGAEYAGYVVDSNQGLWHGSSQSSFEEENLLAYPYSASADPRYFTVSLGQSNLAAYDHFRVFHYTNWSFYEPFIEPGVIGVNYDPIINVRADTQFDVELTVYNYGDADLENVTIAMTYPENLTLTQGLVFQNIGDLSGGEFWYEVYEFIPANVPAVLTILFQVSASNLNDSVSFSVDIYVQEYIPPLIPPNLLFGGIAIFVALGFIVYGYKRVTRTYGAKWEADDSTYVYESPEIAIQTFGEPGTVAELDPIESAFFINTTRQKLVSMILMSCVRKGAVRVLSTDPLKLSVTGLQFQDLTYYEEMFIAAIVDDELDPDKVDDMLEELADQVQEKAWSADFESTKAKHDEMVDGAWDELESYPTLDDKMDYYFNRQYHGGGWAWYWLYMNPRHDHIGDVFDKPGPSITPPTVPDWFSNLSEATGHAISGVGRVVGDVATTTGQIMNNVANAIGSVL
ncbi:MAG: hypothetical protein ACFFEK_14585 [Candidatus Thorarchaeota archaeon]